MNVNTLSISDFGHRLGSIGITSHETSKIAHCIDMFVHKVDPSVASGAHLPQHWALILGGVDEWRRERRQFYIGFLPNLAIGSMSDMEERLSDTLSDGL